MRGDCPLQGARRPRSPYNVSHFRPKFEQPTSCPKYVKRYAPVAVILSNAPPPCQQVFANFFKFINFDKLIGLFLVIAPKRNVS